MRLAHVFFNNMDFGWRTRIRTMLETNPKLSIDEIAEALNEKKTVLVPLARSHGRRRSSARRTSPSPPPDDTNGISLAPTREGDCLRRSVPIPVGCSPRSRGRSQIGLKDRRES